MKRLGVNTVCLAVNFTKVKETLEVGSRDPFSSPEVSQVILSDFGESVMQRWTHIWTQASESPGSASMIVSIPRGETTKMLIGSMDMQNPMTIHLEQFDLLKSVIYQAEA